MSAALLLTIPNPMKFKKRLQTPFTSFFASFIWGLVVQLNLECFQKYNPAYKQPQSTPKWYNNEHKSSSLLLKFIFMCLRRWAQIFYTSKDIHIVDIYVFLTYIDTHMCTYIYITVNCWKTFEQKTQALLLSLSFHRILLNYTVINKYPRKYVCCISKKL